jgi:hypothetical protein
MTASQQVSVRVLDDGRRAVVHIASGVDAAGVTPEILRMLVSEAKVQVTPEVGRRLAEIVEAYRATPQDLVAECAHAIDPVHGADGVWTWEPGFGPAPAAPGTAAGGGATDHYASRIVSVTGGTPVARLTPPGPGADGRSVTGAALPARPGRPAPIHPGEGLLVRPDGVVVATGDGVLRASGSSVAVSPTLEIKGSVDFSTGQVEFKGDVVVGDAVRDGFHIRAGGNVTINGPVEGATIACLGNLICRRGVASSRRAKLMVEGDSEIGYLRNVTAMFKGDLACKGEVEHSDITVGGDLRCESGRVIGGSLVLTGDARIGSLGSPEWVVTLVSVGDLPLVAMELGRLTSDAARILHAVTPKEETLRQLQSGAGAKSAAAREQLTELQYELSELRREAAEVDAKRARIQEAMQQPRSGTLHVARIVHPHVRVQHGGAAFEFDRELKGPLQFLIDEHGAIRVKVSTQNPRPITDFAHAVRAAAAPKPAGQAGDGVHAVGRAGPELRTPVQPAHPR